MRLKPGLMIEKFAVLGSLALIALVVAVLCSVSVVHNTEMLIRTWQDFDTGPAAKMAVLSELQGAGSYDEVKQRFKALTQHPDRTNLDLTRAALAAVDQAIAKYQALGVTTGEATALDAVRSAAADYAAATDLAEATIAGGKSVAKSDGRTTTNDKLAVAALVYLDDGLRQARTTSGEMLTNLGDHAIDVSIGGSVVLCLLLTVLAGSFVWSSFHRPETGAKRSKGFDDVATEVKTLAVQTSKIMSDIDSQINAMRDVGMEAAAAMAKIVGTIGKIDSVATAIGEAADQSGVTLQDFMSGTSAQSTRATEVVQHPNSSGRDAVAAADPGRGPDNLQNEVNRFLMTTGAETDERRRYQRISVKGVLVLLRAEGCDVEVTLKDISRGGAAVACDWKLPAGTMVDIDLPNTDGKVTARVISSDGSDIRLAFAGEPANLARVDRALDALSSRSTTA